LELVVCESQTVKGFGYQISQWCVYPLRCGSVRVVLNLRGNRIVSLQNFWTFDLKRSTTLHA